MRGAPALAAALAAPLAAGLALGGCASAPAYPRASAGADTELWLESNIPSTEFSVDGVLLATGSKAVVLIDGRKSHEVTAKPPEYNAKVEAVQPPYRQPSRLAFYFLLEDRTLKDGAILAPARGAPAPKAPSKDVVKYDQKTRSGSVTLEGGVAGRDRGLKLIGQLCSTKNLAIESGREQLTGGAYKLTDEALSAGLYRMDFRCLE